MQRSAHFPPMSGTGEGSLSAQGAALPVGCVGKPPRGGGSKRWPAGLFWNVGAPEDLPATEDKQGGDAHTTCRWPGTTSQMQRQTVKERLPGYPWSLKGILSSFDAACAAHLPPNHL